MNLYCILGLDCEGWLSGTSGIKAFVLKISCKSGGRNLFVCNCAYLFWWNKNNLCVGRWQRTFTFPISGYLYLSVVVWVHIKTIKAWYRFKLLFSKRIPQEYRSYWLTVTHWLYKNLGVEYLIGLVVFSIEFNKGATEDIQIPENITSTFLGLIIE